MIVKLAHLTFATEKSDIEKMAGGFQGYSVQFREEGLINIDAKSRFFQTCHPDHTLVKLESEQGPPIEIVGYDRCVGQSRAVWSPEERQLHLFTSDLENSMAFWKRIGFVPAERSRREAWMRARFPMDKWPVELRLTQADPIPPEALDLRGMVAAAFAVTGLARWVETLNKAGIQASSPQTLQVNGQQLEISFANSGTGDIAEFFSIKR